MGRAGAGRRSPSVPNVAGGTRRRERSSSPVANHQRFDHGLSTLRASWARLRVLRLTRPRDELLVAIAMR